jgi:hypothetical protein
MNTVVSAIVGGIVGAGVVFFAGNTVDNKDIKNGEMQELKVAKLTITDQATLLNKEGNPEVVLKEGSILAENVIFGKKVVARQMQGHAIVANRVFTTPDDLIATPMENWRFYAEIGSSVEAGGEVVVRNVQGPSVINKPTNGGALFRMGYDPEQRPQMLAMHNPNRSPLEINYGLSEAQKQMLMSSATANQQGMASFNSANATSPVYQQGGANVASPDPNTIRQ